MNFEDPQKRPSRYTKVRAVARCGDPDCRCARYAVPGGLTLEKLFEEVRRDNGALVRRLERHTRGGTAALSDKERVVFRLLGEALSPDGQVGLIGSKCVWNVYRSRLLSALKDVNAGRYTRGFRQDARPGRRPDRDQPDRGGRTRIREQAFDPEVLSQFRELSESAGDPLERMIEDVAPSELVELVSRLSPLLREAIELELVRADKDDFPPLTSTQRVRHFRAARKLAELILERPELDHLHELARELLVKDRRCD